VSTLRWIEFTPEEPPIGPEKPLSCVDGWQSHTWTLDISEGCASVSTKECRLCDDGVSLGLFPEYLNGSFPVTLSLYTEFHGAYGEECDGWWDVVPAADDAIEDLTVERDASRLIINDLTAEVERLRAAGDALAHAMTQVASDEDWSAALRGWEARRER
jgi:hypothetical protein